MGGSGPSPTYVQTPPEISANPLTKCFRYRGVPCRYIVSFSAHQHRKYFRIPHFFGAGDATDTFLTLFYYYEQLKRRFKERPRSGILCFWTIGLSLTQSKRSTKNQCPSPCQCLIIQADTFQLTISISQCLSNQSFNQTRINFAGCD